MVNYLPCDVAVAVAADRSTRSGEDAMLLLLMMTRLMSATNNKLKQFAMGIFLNELFDVIILVG